ncbi:penicillin acylase family protein [Micromonospora sp. M12]
MGRLEPDTNDATYTPASTHPQSVNQDYYVSWNNKQARDFGAADGNFSFGSVHRAQLLDGPVRAAIAQRKLGRADVVKIMADAAVTDLRGQQVLDDLLRVLDSTPVTDPALVDAVGKLRAWQQAGARRVETSPAPRSTSTPTPSGSSTPGGRCWPRRSSAPASGRTSTPRWWTPSR